MNCHATAPRSARRNDVNDDHEQLLQHRQELLLRSARLRQDFSTQVQALRRPLGIADQARDGLQWLARNPEWPLGVALLLMVMRPGRVLRWSGYAFQGYTLYRRAQRVMGQRASPLG